MSYQITKPELGEIVAHLLIQPGVIGELDHKDQSDAFAEDIASVVAEYCGGEFSRLSQPESDMEGALLSFQPNDSLASLRNNLYAKFDPEAYAAEDAVEADRLGVELGEPEEPGALGGARKSLCQAITGDSEWQEWTSKEAVPLNTPLLMEVDTGNGVELEYHVGNFRKTGGGSIVGMVGHQFYFDETIVRWRVLSP